MREAGGGLTGWGYLNQGRPPYKQEVGWGSVTWSGRVNPIYMYRRWVGVTWSGRVNPMVLFQSTLTGS